MMTKLQRDLQRQAEQERQEAWADRKAGVEQRRKSLWVVSAMKDYLPPEHVQLGNKLLRLRAEADGGRMDRERVDGAGNGTESRLNAAMDTLRALAAYDQAAFHRVGADGQACFRAICDGAHTSEAMERCRLPSGSHRSMRKLVQITLLRLHEYDEENERQANPPMRPGEVRSRSLLSSR